MIIGFTSMLLNVNCLNEPSILMCNKLVRYATLVKMHLRGQYKRFEYNESLGSTNKQKIKKMIIP